MANYKTPGVYIQEIPSFPPSVVPVATAVPAFIGYTNRAMDGAKDLNLVPTKIGSMAEYVAHFGTVKQEVGTLTVDESGKITNGLPTLTHRMYYSLQLFFQNGGGDCYIVSVGLDSASAPRFNSLRDGINVLNKEPEPTIIVIPDAPGLTLIDATGAPGEYYTLYNHALTHCQEQMNRVVLIDVPITTKGTYAESDINNFRDAINPTQPQAKSYGIAYYPNLRTNLTFSYDESRVEVSGVTLPDVGGTVFLNKPILEDNEGSLFHSNRNDLYTAIVKQIDDMKLVLPPSAAMAGIYASTDRARGVHIPPANKGVQGTPTVQVDDDKQRTLNVPNDGKSINVIREVSGIGNSVVWGARTLDGSSNEWRYVNVRRYFIYVEQSVKQASFRFVFEPNDKNTWELIKSMITNFLTTEWRQGALAGAKPEDAFFVNVGLGSTMSPLDVLEGRLIIEIGMAVVRPAEFIILKFSHKMQEA